MTNEIATIPTRAELYRQISVLTERVAFLEEEARQKKLLPTCYCSRVLRNKPQKTGGIRG